jgi:hypothetical protein
MGLKAMEENADEPRFWAVLVGFLVLAVATAFGAAGIRCDGRSEILLRGEVVDRLVRARSQTGHWPESESDLALEPGAARRADLSQVRFRLKSVRRDGSREEARYWTVLRGVGRETVVRIDLRRKG